MSVESEKQERVGRRRGKPRLLLGKGRIILGGRVDLINTRLWRPDTRHMIFPWGGSGLMNLSPLFHTEL